MQIIQNIHILYIFPNAGRETRKIKGENEGERAPVVDEAFVPRQANGRGRRVTGGG